jgi:hypothetical protein
MIRARPLLVLTLLAGCVVHRTPAWDPPALPFGAVSTEILDDMVKKGDQAFARRDDPAQLDEALDEWRGALRYRPADPALLLRLSQASRLRARTLSGSDAEDKANDAISYAERALSAHNPKLVERVEKKQRPGDMFAAATPEDARALAAYAEALYEWAARHGTATLLDQRDWILGAAGRAVQLDRSIDFAAPDRVMGIMLATLSPELGGDLRASQEHFEAALAAAPGFLPTRLEYAQSWCVHMRDGDAYRRLLKEAAEGNPELLPAAAPENRAAKKRAHKLLQEAHGW